MPADPTPEQQRALQLLMALHDHCRAHQMPLAITLQLDEPLEQPDRFTEQIALVYDAPDGLRMGPVMKVALAALDAVEQCLESGQIPTGEVALATVEGSVQMDEHLH